MNLVQIFEKEKETKKIPDIRPGDVVKVHEKIKEKDKERIQVFEGVVIKIKGGKGINGNITVRKIAAGGVGVERIYPFYLPALSKIEVVRRGKVRRAKLYYLREKQAKEARLKEKKLTKEELGKLKYEEKVEKLAIEKETKPKEEKPKEKVETKQPKVEVKKEEKK